MASAMLLTLYWGPTDSAASIHFFFFFFPEDSKLGFPLGKALASGTDAALLQNGVLSLPTAQAYTPTRTAFEVSLQFDLGQ